MFSTLLPKTRVTLLSTALLLGIAPVVLAQYRGASLDSGVDQSIKPGDDFFGYANGAWLRSTEIPAGRERWTVRNEIVLTTEHRVAQLLDSAATAPAGSLARKVADFRAAYLNEAAIESHGIAPIKPLLDSIDALQDKTALARHLGRWMPADVDPLNWGIYRSSFLLGLSVEPSIHGEKNNVAFLLQGGLGLPDRENYISNDTAMVSLRARYQDYIGSQLALAGFEHGPQVAQAILALETAIARSQASKEATANDHNADSVWATADFTRRAPGMDWSAFFAAAGLSRVDSIGVWQPSAVTGLAALVGSESLETWKHYLRFLVIHRYADVLPRGFGVAVESLRAASGQPQTSRADRALVVTQSSLGEALGRLYVERYFPAEQKQRIETIVANVKAAFIRRLQAVTWMSPESKRLALAKLNVLYVGIGYPERWQDYSGLSVDPADPVSNLRRVADLSSRRNLARLGRPVDRWEWWMAPNTVGAVLIFQQDSYNFPAALLQPAKFDPAASDAANYGAIGAILGHEISHTVDLLGAEWDDHLAMRHWWTDEDGSRFQAVAQRLVDQVSGYKPFSDLGLDGKRSMVENVADLGGLMAAFDAYRATLGSRVNDRDYVRRMDREFFMGFARSWRSKSSEAGLRAQIASDNHAPDRYRIATVRNLDAWYEAFDVKPGDALYLEPAQRVRVW
jgi:predicted metalloendopeptidase